MHSWPSEREERGGGEAFTLGLVGPLAIFLKFNLFVFGCAGPLFSLVTASGLFILLLRSTGSKMGAQ